MNGDQTGRPTGILLASVLMVLFGLAEVATAFSHNFLGITTSQVSAEDYSSALIGSFYVLAGLLVLTMKKWGAYLAILFLIADILGRLGLVVSGLYPLNTVENTFGIVAGTTIALIFLIYIYTKRTIFQ
ncbi:MAG TPA: hypothetical protein VED17_05715 [Nitrososphaerales archaeon]|nr:hypothetical protein [Nitrososphaerales archaeon]